MSQITRLAGELNFVVSYWWNGCRTPFNLMVECAREPAGIVALALLDTGFDDLARSLTRPGGGGHRPGSRRNRGGKLPKFDGIPEISDMAASRIDGIKEMRARDVQQGVRSLWALDGLLQRAVWNVVVVELASDFTFRSILGMLSLKQTKCDVPGRCNIKGNDIDAFNNGQWYFLPFQEVVYVEWPVYVSPAGAFTEDENYYMLLCECVAFNNSPGSGDVQWEFRVAAAEGGGIYQSAVFPVGGGGTVSTFFSLIVKGGFQIQLYQRSHADIIFVNHSIVAFPSMFTDL